MDAVVLFGATSLGLQYALLAVGIFITFRILDMADLTVDGSFCLGMAVSTVLTVNGLAEISLVAGALAGALAGCVTGILATKARINPLIAGLITSTGLYSINIYVLGAPNVTMLGIKKAFDAVQRLLFPASPGTEAPTAVTTTNALPETDISKFVFTLLIVVVIVTVLIAYFKTESGLAMRAVGDNEQMSAASSINVDAVKIFGLALGNALVGLSGSIIAQCQGFADMTSGVGMVMIGLASVIIGEVFGGKRSVTAGLICSVLGSVVYRVIIQVALGVNMEANSLKLVSALIVGLFMALPAIRDFFKESKVRRNAYADLGSSKTLSNKDGKEV